MDISVVHSHTVNLAQLNAFFRHVIAVLIVALLLDLLVETHLQIMMTMFRMLESIPSTIYSSKIYYVYGVPRSPQFNFNDSMIMCMLFIIAIKGIFVA